MTNQLTRTCAACGVEKPLAAFLFLTGKAGTAYGTICATCRGKGINEQSLKKPVVEEDRTSTTTTLGLRIGAKQLAEMEAQQKQDKLERQELKDAEFKKHEELSHEKSESAELKEKDQKLLREQYINSIKSQGFLKNLSGTQSITQIAHIKHQAVETIRRTEIAAQQEKQKTTFDLTTTPGENTVTRDVTLQRMQAMLSQDAPVMKAMQFYKSLAPGQKNPPGTREEKVREESPREFIQNRWRKR